MGLNFGQTARSAAIAWKQSSATLPDPAREAADMVRPDGRTMHGPFEFCLPPAHARANLLPEAERAVDMFSSLGIAWPGSIDGGPGNQLLDTWVQCANALVPLTGDAERLALFLAQALPVGAIEPIENDWLVTFGWSGLTDHLGDEAGQPPPRGPGAVTFAHAAVKHTAEDGAAEVVLIAWFYAESFRDASPQAPRKLAARAARYRTLAQQGAPLLRPDIDLSEFLVEPFDRLLRLHLLARAMERSGELGAQRVRVLLVAPSENLDFAQSLTTPTHRALGATVPDVWRAALHPDAVDAFAELDSSVLIDPALDITSEEFRRRYGDLEAKVEDLDVGLAWRAGKTDGSQVVTNRSPSWDRRQRRA